MEEFNAGVDACIKRLMQERLETVYRSDTWKYLTYLINELKKHKK